MASILPNFDPFDIHADGAVAQRWRKWIKRLQNLFVAANIKDKQRQRVLLLYYAGEEVCEIFETIPESGDDFDKAKEKLNEYFGPKKNIEYEIYTFRQAKQNSGESMNSYHSRLRQLASTCEFADTDKEIKSQIILSCSSQRLRCKALKDTTMTLQALLDEARALEVSEKQAVDIESSGSANAVLPLKSKTPEKKSICFNCGESWPHVSGGCPPRNRKCNSCQRYGHYAKCCRNGRRSSNPVRTPQKGSKWQGRTTHKSKPFKTVNQVKQGLGSASSSDEEYTFRVEVPSKVSASFVPLEIKFASS